MKEGRAYSERTQLQGPLRRLPILSFLQQQVLLCEMGGGNNSDLMGVGGVDYVR